MLESCEVAGTILEHENDTMYNSDVNMSDGETDDSLLAYNIPHPPKLPDKEANWERYSETYGARRNKTGFDVRKINVADPTGHGRFEKKDWPMEQRLGYPSAKAGWHPLIYKWGLQVLDAAGFINFEATKPSNYNPVGYWDSKRNKSGTLAERIHPVLRKEMWHLLTDEEYDTIAPALLLASAILDDPVMLNLFHALSRPTDQLTTFWDSHLGECKRLNIPDTLTEKEQWEVYRKLEAMRQWTSFRWTDSASFATSGSLGITTPTCELGRDVPASGPISVEFYHAMYLYNQKNQDFNAVLNGAMNVAEVPEDHKIPHIDPLSAIKRTNLIFAITLVHEFMHAFNQAYFQRPIGAEGPSEPWLADNRSNELGWATTQYLFTGAPNATTFLDSTSGPAMERHANIYIPFGLYFGEKWDQWRPGGETEHVLMEDWWVFHAAAFAIYPVPQEYVHDVTTGETWEERVPRDGLQVALRLPKLHEWAVRLKPGRDIMNPLDGITIV